MKLFIWERIARCTSNWHPEGGLVVIAESEEIARALANAEDGCVVDPSEAVTFTCDTDATERRVFIFPDAGCC